MAVVERPTHWGPTTQAVVHISESDTQHLQRWLQTQSMRAGDLEQLSGIWKGESMQEGGTSPTIWGETDMTFTRENNTCRLKGAGTSKWQGQVIEFRLVGTVDPTNMRFEMYKTHIGAFNNTILFKGRVELSPPRLLGNSLKGTVTLERIQSRPSEGQDYYQLRPSDSTTLYERSKPSDVNNDFWVKRTGDFTAASAYIPQPLHLTKDPSFRETLRQQTEHGRPAPLGPLDTAYTRVKYCDVITPASNLFPDRVTSDVLAEWHQPESAVTPTATPRSPYTSNTTVPLSPDTRGRSEKLVDSSPRKRSDFLGEQPREKDGYPTCPPEDTAPLSPTGNPQLYSDHSRDYNPSLKLSTKTKKTGDPAIDAANLCGVWSGSSRKKTVSHPTGEVTEWNDVVIYFNLKQGSTGNIRGRGESVWRATAIPFLLEGTFDLEQSTVHLRKIHVGKFNNIVSYDLLLGSQEDFLRLTLGGDEGSLELKQAQQVCDRLPRSPQSPLPETTSPSKLLLPKGSAGPNQTLPDSPRGTLYTTLSFNSMLPPRASFGSLEQPVYTMLPLTAMEGAATQVKQDAQNAPVYTMLPLTAMEMAPSEPRDVRVSSYCLFLSGLLVSEALSQQQQQALAAYRLNNHITEHEHQASLELLNLTSREFEKRLRSRSDDLCKVCYERPLDCVLLPCGHLTTCVKCSGKLDTCPVCRQVIAETKRVFRS